MTQSDYYLLLGLNKWLQVKKFHSNEEIEWETDAYFADLETDHFSKGLELSEQTDNS